VGQRGHISEYQGAGLMKGIDDMLRGPDARNHKLNPMPAQHLKMFMKVSSLYHEICAVGSILRLNHFPKVHQQGIEIIDAPTIRRWESADDARATCGHDQVAT
jgi:hypothetical protein